MLLACNPGYNEEQDRMTALVLYLLSADCVRYRNITENLNDVIFTVNVPILIFIYNFGDVDVDPHVLLNDGQCTSTSSCCMKMKSTSVP